MTVSEALETRDLSTLYQNTTPLKGEEPCHRRRTSERLDRPRHRGDARAASLKVGGRKGQKAESSAERKGSGRPSLHLNLPERRCCDSLKDASGSASASVESSRRFPSLNPFTFLKNRNRVGSDASCHSASSGRVSLSSAAGNKDEEQIEQQRMSRRRKARYSTTTSSTASTSVEDLRVFNFDPSDLGNEGTLGFRRHADPIPQLAIAQKPKKKRDMVGNRHHEKDAEILSLHNCPTIEITRVSSPMSSMEEHFHTELRNADEFLAKLAKFADVSSTQSNHPLDWEPSRKPRRSILVTQENLPSSGELTADGSLSHDTTTTSYHARLTSLSNLLTSVPTPNFGVHTGQTNATSSNGCQGTSPRTVSTHHFPFPFRWSKEDQRKVSFGRKLRLAVSFYEAQEWSQDESLDRDELDPYDRELLTNPVDVEVSDEDEDDEEFSLRRPRCDSEEWTPCNVRDSSDSMLGGRNLTFTSDELTSPALIDVEAESIARLLSADDSVLDLRLTPVTFTRKESASQVNLGTDGKTPLPLDRITLEKLYDDDDYSWEDHPGEEFQSLRFALQEARENMGRLLDESVTLRRNDAHLATIIRRARWRTRRKMAAMKAAEKLNNRKNEKVMYRR